MGWGQLLGAAAGYLLAPATGGASLALTAAGLGAGLGGAAEEALGGGATGAAKQAASIANSAADRELALRRQMYEEGVARQKPFYEAGVNALPEYLSGIRQGGELVRGFTSADYQEDPGYAFRLTEGMKALDRTAASRGGLLSGATLKGAQRYGQGLASQEYQNAYDRFRDTQGLRRNALAGVVGYGPTSSNAMTSAGSNYASGAGPVISGQGETSANALLAGQRARQSAYGEVGSALGKYLGSSSNTPFGFGKVNPSSGEYYGSLEF
jgi:hypothetical protein